MARTPGTLVGGLKGPPTHPNYILPPTPTKRQFLMAINQSILVVSARIGGGLVFRGDLFAIPPSDTGIGFVAHPTMCQVVAFQVRHYFIIGSSQRQGNRPTGPTRLTHQQTEREGGGP